MSLFFVHIPKTAGTSFRRGAEAYFSPERIVYDYGPNAKATSPFVKESLHVDQPDFWQFKKALDNPAMIVGHVPIVRFVSLWGVGNTITFLREPLQRIASEYAHFVRNKNYTGSFKEFYLDPGLRNRQRRALYGVNLEAIGLIGFTERYSESLEMLNDRYATRILEREDNRGKSRLEDEYELDEKDVIELRKLNRRDIELYQYALALFDSRYAMFKSNQPWAHACIEEANTEGVSGWAWWADEQDAPVEIELWVNGELSSTVLAVKLCKELCHLLPPRGGYVGFNLPLKLSPLDTVQCRVAATGQWFPPNPRSVEETVT
ncbi:sulfotransferase family 2 domain-containing protein [Halomonas sp. ISL-56]|uniref:sulfotransferase family 2 domain-containing protein n=1 Tax=Halomonas sp. ISL-56 TaxID=2819149 RepID=UPI001BE833AC|nr:sulfotransferase family 2 domain-containing protein [Halomonas sp. ISL-56]MBT2801114.1 sulfotransferase family 2 domain-containing protein [Halomonas sp. ISL-56]